MNYCAAQLMGRLTRDVDLRDRSGTSVANFTIAVNRRTGRGDEQYTSYFDCAAFGKTAEAIARNFSKGRPIFIAGHPKQERWDKDGKTHQRIRFIVEQFSFIDHKPSGQTSSRTPAATLGLDGPHQPISEDEIPF